MEEIWKPINNFKGIYSISNYGRVKREERESLRVVNGKERPYKNKEIILKLSKNSAGYERVTLWDDSKKERKFVHRIVAEHFIENPLKKPIVNHIDGFKTNNNCENLEWVTSSENSRHSFDVLGFVPNTSGINPKREVNQLDKNTGEIIEMFDSIREAYDKTKILHISSVCAGNRNTAGGFKWEYTE